MKYNVWNVNAWDWLQFLSMHTWFLGALWTLEYQYLSCELSVLKVSEQNFLSSYCYNCIENEWWHTKFLFSTINVIRLLPEALNINWPMPCYHEHTFDFYFIHFHFFNLNAWIWIIVICRYVELDRFFFWLVKIMNRQKRKIKFNPQNCRWIELSSVSLDKQST